MKIEKELQEKYNNYYTSIDEQWRMNGAISKAKNIESLVKGKEFNKLVEVGAGDGSILSLLSKKEIAREFYALEISTSGIEAIKAKNILKLKEVSLFDGYSIPYPDKFFDLAICSHVIEHVEHPRLLLREIKRVSKQQVFEVPIDFSFNVDKKTEHFLSYGHINIFTPALFRFLLISEKFTLLKDLRKMYNISAILYGKESMVKKIVKIIKLLLFKCIPFLRNIKPHSYAVLTE